MRTPTLYKQASIAHVRANEREQQNDTIAQHRARCLMVQMSDDILDQCDTIDLHFTIDFDYKR